MPLPEPSELMSDLAAANALTDVRSLLAEVMIAFGGQRTFAEGFVEDVDHSDVGSNARLGAKTAYMRALIQHGHVEGGEEEESPAAIEAEIRRLLTKAEPPGEDNESS